MSPPPLHVVFVAPFFLAATLRFIAATAALEGVRLSLVSQDPLERLPAALRERLVGHWRVADALDAAQIVAAVRELGRGGGAVHRLVASLEQLQEPLAIAARELGLPGLDPQAARRLRDKRRMKDAFVQADVPCARYAQIGDATAARDFAARSGWPLVAKPLAGAGARHTFRIEDPATLERYLARYPPRADQPGCCSRSSCAGANTLDAAVLRAASWCRGARSRCMRRRR
ncbi:MAG: hypothetical protein R3E65_07255 [Steroidobacteraceae bacterium]